MASIRHLQPILIANKMADENSIVLNYYDDVLRMSDVQLLTGPHWLNDTIISFFFQYLEKFQFQMNPEFLFVSPQVTQCVKICAEEELPVFLEPLHCQTRQLIFFALNDNQLCDVAGGHHWSLLVYDQRCRNCFHYDSSQGSNAAEAKKLGKRVMRYFGLSSKANVTEVDCLQQVNPYDCGIHLLAQCEQLATHAKTVCRIANVPAMGLNAVDTKRKEILALIENLAASQLA